MSPGSCSVNDTVKKERCCACITSYETGRGPGETKYHSAQNSQMNFKLLATICVFVALNQAY